MITAYRKQKILATMFWLHVRGLIASCHKSKTIREHVESAGDDIALEFLPPYTPQLNPIETMWRDLERWLAGISALLTS